MRYSMMLSVAAQLVLAVISSSGVTAHSGIALQGPTSAGAQPGTELSVYLVTMGPGREVWEWFGHNALWVRDSQRGVDHVYNYGMFSFEQEDFLLSFVRGRLVYWMEGFDTEAHLKTYIAANRSVWIQELNLTPRQRFALRDFLEWNDRPENRFYQYDYYLDNCSTRIRDALDRVLGGRIRQQTELTETSTTYRFHTQRIVANDVFVHTGLLLALGQDVDRPLTAWKEMYLPLKMRERVREITVLDAQGSVVPLVRSERTLFASSRAPLPGRPPSWSLAYLGVGVMIAVGLIGLGVKARESRIARVAASCLTGFWTLLTGAGGLVLAVLWAFTDHWAAYRNENLFFFNPLAFLLVVLLPLLVLRVRWAPRASVMLGLAVAGLSVLGFGLQLLPWMDQANGQVVSLALLPNVAMAWVIHQLSSGEPAAAG